MNDQNYLHIALIYLVIINVVTFFVYGIDKWKAKKFVPMHFVASGFESSWRMKEFTDEKNIPFWEINKEGETIEV